MVEQRKQNSQLKRRVVIIDDEPALCKFLANMVERLGYEVRTASDAATVYLHELKDSDIIFLDVLMPGMDGIQILEVLSRRNAKCRIVLMSGADSGLAEAEAMAKERGLRLIGVLYKPFRLDDVKLVLQDD